MKATDFRDMTFLDLQRYVNLSRKAVYEAWLRHGPCTTMELSTQTGISVLNIRPRTTDLVQCGLVEIDPDNPRSGTEGRYRAITMAEWQRRKAIAPPKPQQVLMKF